MLELAPTSLPAKTRFSEPGSFQAKGPRQRRVAMLTGCVQPAIDPGKQLQDIQPLVESGRAVAIVVFVIHASAP